MSMNRSKFFYIYFALPLFSLFYGFAPLTAESSDIVESENIYYTSESGEGEVAHITFDQLAKLIKQSELAIKSKGVKKKILHKRNSWDKLIAVTGDVDTDFNSVISLLEANKDSNWDNWKLIPKRDPVIIRSDYVTEINGHKVRTAFVTYVNTKKTFLQNAWVVSE